MTRPRVAIAHDYLTQRGGAERVVLSLLKAFPGAPLYTTLYDPAGTYPEFRDVRMVTSFLNRLPALRRDHRRALPLLPAAASSLRIDADVVVASSSAYAHGFPTAGRKVVYYHSPARFLYLPEQYLGGRMTASPRGLALAALRRPFVAWDQRAAATADVRLCNSSVIRDRIAAVYGADAEVLPPPAGIVPEGPMTQPAALDDWADGFHLVVSRLLPYKNVGAVIEAFRASPERLVVVGRGPIRDQLAAAAPPNVRLTQGLSDAELRWVYAHSRALVAASHEDFGLTPLEAGAFGKPVVALRAGGYLDTVVAGVNGTFFDEPTPAAIAAALRRHSATAWPEEVVRAQAARFSEERFIERIRQVALGDPGLTAPPGDPASGPY